MEKTLFSALTIGNTVTSPYMVLDIKEGVTKTQKPYVDVELSDGVERVWAKKWDTTAVQLGFATGAVAIFTLKAEDYKGARQFLINEIAPAREGDYNIQDFVKKAPIDSVALYNKIYNTAKAFTNEFLRNVVTGILEEKKNVLIYFAAAKKAHHAYFGGLLYHTYRMLATANFVAKQYPVIDHNLLMAGVILHDIGKLEELGCNELGLVSDYTTDGKMFGHSYLGARYVHDYALTHGYSADDVRLLEHLIASHSGTAEYGAIAKPSTPEAWALHLIDLLDARMNEVEDQLNSLEEGTWSEPAYFLESARIYKAVKPQPQPENQPQQQSQTEQQPDSQQSAPQSGGKDGE